MCLWVLLYLNYCTVHAMTMAVLTVDFIIFLSILYQTADTHIKAWRQSVYSFYAEAQDQGCMPIQHFK